MIRKILVPIRGDGKGENVLAHAALLARRFDAHIVAVHSRPKPEDMLPFGIPIPGILRDEIIKSSSEVANAEETKLRHEFDDWAERFGLTQSDRPIANTPTVSWREAQGKQVDVIKIYGRLADLIAVAKPDRDRNLGANTLKSALFHTGRPVLMCPMAKQVPASIGTHVAIAWNGSTEVARAVALTLNLIQSAERVTVLSGHEELHGASAEELLDYFGMRNISAGIRRIVTTGRIGDTLLAEAAATGADLLIMGAYRNSHEHETFFGGNTQTVVDHSSMPVVLVH